MNFRGRRGNAQRKQKRPNEENADVTEDSSPIAKLFKTYQIELDSRYDKHERLVKKSRDLTIESKRIIFLLHRVSSDGGKDEILKEAEDRLSDLFKNVISGISSELSKRELYQFLRAFSPGLQEFVEAFSFYYYLKHETLVHIGEIHNPDFLQKSSEIPVDHKSPESGLPLSALLTPTDFILGIADLTGELMRKCINSVAAGDIEEPFRLCNVLQNIYEALGSFNYNRELKRKLMVLKNSMQKVENACYAIKIRGSEIPKHMLTDFFSNEEEFKENIDCDV
ncbi:translin-associated protein X-like [Argiope bruennichi]|uniref:Translin-associated protein X like protein n=1 Tax=Argiope bruennichi TaxID=94029 RepID=A0A8T0FDC1_ARGBR|nr:translin-associated protein X-like [Argiope bruennichi]KAF8788911.1 Translin-associated protein X like protein [Argiope bruennichi]